MKSKDIGLVLSGGGFNAFTFIGAIQLLEEIECLHKINTFVGTSAGGFLCMLLWIGIPIKAIVEFCNDVSILQCFSMINMNLNDITSNTYGVLDTQHIKNKLSQLISIYYHADVTLYEVYIHTLKKCTIVTTDIITMSEVYINHINFPCMRCVDAIISTISIPFIFPVNYVDDYVLIDGCFQNNFPVQFAIEHYSLHPHNVIPICINVKSLISKTCINDLDAFSYINSIYDLTSNYILIHQYHWFNETNKDICVIDNCKSNINILNFMNLEECKQNINKQIQIGYSEFDLFLKRLPDCIATFFYLDTKYND
tara:strand:- start:492 stop:1424 length:933 start_codon:yes stop_codon:yes gene_type:complete